MRAVYQGVSEPINSVNERRTRAGGRGSEVSSKGRVCALAYTITRDREGVRPASLALASHIRSVSI